MFQYIFKRSILIIFCLIFLFYCDDIPRDNILDPKNPSSERQKIVTIEAFVYTGSDAPNTLNETVLYALDQIENAYGNKVTIMEYHRNTTNYSADPYVTDPYNNYSNENLYDIYTGNVGEGVPDVFINGIAARVQGASTVQNSVFRLEQALQPFIIQNSLFTIEPQASIQNGEIDLSLKIAKLGSSNAQDIIVKAIIVYKIDNDILERVVHGIGKSTIIEEIENGEIKEVDIDPIPLAQFSYQSISVIFAVTSEDEKSIYQSIEVDIP